MRFWIIVSPWHCTKRRDYQSNKCKVNRDMPFQEFGIGDEACLNPPRDLAFIGSLDRPAAFHALLATGAIHLTSIRHVKASFIAYHLAESLRLLQEGMKKGTNPINIKSLIGAAAALASVGDRRPTSGGGAASRT